MREYFPVLANCPLFSGLDSKVLAQWLEDLSPIVRILSRDQFLFHLGDLTRQIGIVLSGSLHILYEDAFGNRSILAVVEPLDMFAEAYACAGASLEVSVAARESSVVMLLDSQTLFRASGGPFEQIRGNLLRILAGKNLVLNEKIRHLTRRTTREKLLSYLSAQQQKAGRRSFQIPFDRQQLADYLAVDRSAMCTELGKLCREGYVQCRGRWFTLPET